MHTGMYCVNDNYVKGVYIEHVSVCVNHLCGVCLLVCNTNRIVLTPNPNLYPMPT